MDIKMLGNGGAICDGLPYNSFIIDSELLVEVPPDIIQSLYRHNIPLAEISSIYISHFHGDHYFGIPFLALRQFFDDQDRKIKVIGPQGIERQILDLTISAFGETHPVINWIKEYYMFLEISEYNPITISQDFEIMPIKMFHLVETYGFQCSGNLSRFTYLSDSSWNDQLLDYIKDKATVVLTDLNGEPTDNTKIHISEIDLITKALPYLNPETIFYGTHLKYEKEPNSDRILFVKAGDSISV